MGAGDGACVFVRAHAHGCACVSLFFSACILRLVCGEAIDKEREGERASSFQCAFWHVYVKERGVKLKHREWDSG